MTEYGIVYSVAESGSNWQISFRRNDGSDGTLFVPKAGFRKWYESKVRRSYRADYRAGVVGPQLEGERLRLWYEGGKGYWALA
jgi:hypothetical protein